VTTNVTAKPEVHFDTKQTMVVPWSLTRAAVKLMELQDYDLSYTIPHMAKCRTEAVNNLSRRLEPCKMRNINLSKPKFLKMSESVIFATLTIKSSSHKLWQTLLLYLKPLQIQDLKIKMWGTCSAGFTYRLHRLKPTGPQDPRGPPTNCGTHRVSGRYMII